MPHTNNDFFGHPSNVFGQTSTRPSLATPTAGLAAAGGAPRPVTTTRQTTEQLGETATRAGLGAATRSSNLVAQPAEQRRQQKARDRAAAEQRLATQRAQQEAINQRSRDEAAARRTGGSLVGGQFVGGTGSAGGGGGGAGGGGGFGTFPNDPSLARQLTVANAPSSLSTQQFGQQQTQDRTRTALQEQFRQGAIDAIPGLLNAGGGGGDPFPVGGGDTTARDAALAASAGRAQERIGLATQGALRGLEGSLTSRGISGPIEGGAVGNVLATGLQQRGEFERDQALAEAARLASVEDRNFAGNLALRTGRQQNIGPILGLLSQGGNIF